MQVALSFYLFQINWTQVGEADTACLAIMGEIQGRSELFYSYNINPNIIMGEIQGRFYNDMNKDFKGHGFDDCCNCCVSFISNIVISGLEVFWERVGSRGREHAGRSML